MKVLEIEFYLMHILFKISRRHYCLGGSYGLGRIIYTDEHDGNLCFQCNEVKSLFPVRVGFTRSFRGDGQMELFAFGKFVGHLVYQGSIPAPVYRYAADGFEYQSQRKEKPLFFHHEAGLPSDGAVKQFADK